MITWVERTPSLYEARLVMPDGREVYVGYVALRPGVTEWRGYIGRTFTPIGVGPLSMMQQRVEQRARTALERSGGGGDDVGSVEGGGVDNAS